MLAYHVVHAVRVVRRHLQNPSRSPQPGPVPGNPREWVVSSRGLRRPRGVKRKTGNYPVGGLVPWTAGAMPGSP